MRTFSLLVGISVLASSQAAAQQQWRAVKAPTSQPLAFDLRSLRVAGSVVSIDVRTPIGGGLYNVVAHDIRCMDLSVRLGHPRTYDADTRRLTAPPEAVAPHPSPTWVQYGPGSDGRLVASAVCDLARQRGLLTTHTSSVGWR